MKRISQNYDQPVDEIKTQFSNDYYKKLNIEIDKIVEMPLLLEALRIIGKYAKSDQFIDLHSGNIMKRSTGELVIIDPYAIR